MKEYLRKFILTHSNWEELLSQPPYSLKIQRNEGYILFKYNQLSSDFSLPEVQEARGIIFREQDFQCVCRAFDKFGNYGESYVKDLDWGNSVSVQEKVDGALMKVWYDNGWHLSTNASINAFKTDTGDAKIKTFGLLFELALNKYGYMFDPFKEFSKNLNTDYTYIFELVSPYNRIVIPYNEPRIYYLGQRSMITLEEEYYREEWKNFNLPKLYNLTSLDSVINAANKLPWDKEGYVCVDKNFNRCKIKSPKYLLAHYSRNNNVISKKHLISIILQNQIEEFLIYANDYKDELFKVHANMYGVKNYFTQVLNAIPEDIKNGNKKEYAIYIQKNYGTNTDIDKLLYDFLIRNYYAPLSVDMYVKEWNERKWEKVIDNWNIYKKRRDKK